MKKHRNYRFWLVLFLLIGAVTAPLIPAEKIPKVNTVYRLKRLFPAAPETAQAYPDTLIANLILDDNQDYPQLIVPVSNGILDFLDASTGASQGQVELPHDKHQQAQLVATPIKVENWLCVIYQIVENGIRNSHRMAMLDLTSKRFDSRFPVLELRAQKPAAQSGKMVRFNPPTAYSHAALKHGKRAGQSLGMLYAGFGNAGDTQPFHGWLFEIDLDAWFRGNKDKALANVLLTTPEAECPVTVEWGTQEMICGGGIWSPTGPVIINSNGDYELYVPTGNGQLDLSKGDYANALLRVKPGLDFDPGCDANLCQNFNAANPEPACLNSCKNLFVPRLPEQQHPFRPSSGACDTKTFNECLAWMDYDLGGNSPVKVQLSNGQSVLVQPSKDGAVYLLDAEHLGRQYQRLQIAEICGTAFDECKAGWMGMIVTQPVVHYSNGDPIVIVPTYMPDKSHPAGIVALKIVVKQGVPTFKRHWQFPNPRTDKSVTLFRSHPSYPVISKLGKRQDTVVWVADIGNPGTLYAIRVNDGTLLVEQKLMGTGRPLSAPVIFGDTLYLSSAFPMTGQSFVEAYRIESLEE